MASAVEVTVATTQNSTEYNQAEIDKLMSEGKKLYATKDIQGACDIFGDICAKLAEKFGQTASECGDAYLYYGRSLLDIARTESDVLGSSVPKGDLSTKNANEESDGEGTATEEEPMEEKVSSSEKEENADKEECPSKVSAQQKEDGEENEVENGEEDEETSDEKRTNAEASNQSGNEEENGDKNTESENEEDEGEESANTEDENGPEDEVSSMQQAWEILELSRIVFARNELKEQKLKQAEANLLLGEIGMELEHYPEAIGDFMECLRIQEKYLEPNDRRLAETLYNLGLAYSFDRHYGKAIEYYGKAIKVINLRVEDLTKEGNDSSGSTELKELKELLPEMQAKVEDAEYMKKSTEEIIKSAACIAKESLDNAESSSFDEPMESEKEGTSQAKVTNIGHLVRKKRKTDEPDESAPKKAKENEENGEK